MAASHRAACLVSSELGDPPYDGSTGGLDFQYQRPPLLSPRTSGRRSVGKPRACHNLGRSNQTKGRSNCHKQCPWVCGHLADSNIHIDVVRSKQIDLLTCRDASPENVVHQLPMAWTID